MNNWPLLQQQHQNCESIFIINEKKKYIICEKNEIEMLQAYVIIVLQMPCASHRTSAQLICDPTVILYLSMCPEGPSYNNWEICKNQLYCTCEVKLYGL